MGAARITFHLPGDWLADGGARLLPFYRKTVEGLTDRGVDIVLRPIDRDSLAETVAGDDSFHILNHARHPHPRVLTAGVAYVYPFWHLDPLGIRAFSSIREAPFDPGRIDRVRAERLFDRMVRRNVAARRSRYEQPDEAETPHEGHIAVFFQSEGHRLVGETCHMDRWTMLETCLAAAAGRPVVVKPHPREVSMETFDRLVAMQEKHASLAISLGNIHDLLAHADRVVTINSAVGVEAYLHRRSVILCGQSDFHHIAQEVTTPLALAEALAAPAPQVDHVAYIGWYFGRMCLNAGAGDLADRVLARVRKTGYAI